MNAKTSVFVICVKGIIYLLSYNLHDRTFNIVSLRVALEIDNNDSNLI